MIPVAQRELDIFKAMVWNTHRIRPQKEQFYLTVFQTTFIVFRSNMGWKNVVISPFQCFVNRRFPK